MVEHKSQREIVSFDIKDLEPFSMFILMDKEVSLIPSSVGRFSSLMALFAA